MSLVSGDKQPQCGHISLLLDSFTEMFINEHGLNYHIIS